MEATDASETRRDSDKKCVTAGTAEERSHVKEASSQTDPKVQG